jgi:hypothetical protein
MFWFYGHWAEIIYTLWHHNVINNSVSCATIILFGGFMYMNDVFFFCVALSLLSLASSDIGFFFWVRLFFAGHVQNATYTVEKETE